MRGVVVEHRCRDAVGRREAGCHAVGGHDRDRFSIGNQLLDRNAGVMHMGAAIRPVVHDVMVVGNLDIFEIGGAEFLHLRNQKIRETFPARAAGIRRAALAFEHVPVPRLLRRDHQLRVDPGKSRMRTGLGRPNDTLRRERLSHLPHLPHLPHQSRARGDSRSRLEERPPGKTLTRSAHGALPKLHAVCMQVWPISCAEARVFCEVSAPHESRRLPLPPTMRTEPARLGPCYKSTSSKTGWLSEIVAKASTGESAGNAKKRWTVRRYS